MPMAPPMTARMVEPRFSHLIGLLGVDRLRDHMAHGKLLHLPAPGFDPATLITWAELERAIDERRIPHKSFKAFAGYRPVDVAALGGVDRGRIVPATLRKLAAERTTFVFNFIDQIFPHFWTFAHEAEQILGDYVTLGAIVSHGTETGIEPHHDPESLILVQVTGEKLWRFFDPPGPDASERPIAEVLMRPGDLLFVPPDLRHVCAANGFSLHFGALIHHQRGIAWTRELVASLQDDNDFSAPLLRFLGPEAFEQRVATYRATLLKRLAETDAAALLDRRLARRLRGPDFAPPALADG